MTQKIVINPVTRISGFLEIDAFIEHDTVVNAKTPGLLFRGFEKMLMGRQPFDAVYFTQRICGICSAAHSVASSIALENALQVIPSEQGRYLRDIIHACEFLQNHIRHFYQYTIPDFVKLPANNPLFITNHTDFRLPKAQNDRIVQHYSDSLAFSRNAHEMLALWGGKAPHNHGIFIGGSTSAATIDEITKMRTMLKKIKQFIEEKMIPDVYTIANYYPEYYHIGQGCGNLLSFGCFHGYRSLGTLYVNPSVYTNGCTQTLKPDEITENIDHSWYQDRVTTYTPFETVPEADMQKENAYSWVKAPRYQGKPYEVGPLARMWLCGAYRNGISTMDRTIARVLEAKKITEIMLTLLNSLIPEVTTQKEYTIPASAKGVGMVDTTRGALGHWLKIENSVISFYQIITPSAWNLSSKDSKNIHGPAEQALIGTSIHNSASPVELGRIIRSFDPCVSCATHVYTKEQPMQTIPIMP